MIKLPAFSRSSAVRASVALAAGALWFLAGCASHKPQPAPAPAVTEAGRHVQSASKLSAAENWAAAAREWEVAADLYQVLDRAVERAVALHNLAQAQLHLGQLEPARQNAQKAAQLNLDAHQEAPWWRNQILLLQLEARDNPEALANHFANLIPKAAAIRDAETRGLFFNELGLRQTGKGDFADARRNYQLAEASFQRSGSTLGLAVVAANRAATAEQEGNLPQAQEWWTRARALFSGLGHVEGLARANVALGSAWLAANTNVVQAADLLLAASKGYRLLRRNAEERSSLEKALEAARAIDDSRAVEAATKRLEELSRPAPK